jgi:BirA family transcriptional regulator, biotin operon repressor / biotin---[acetyl-CoA-carboxylase] ligase
MATDAGGAMGGIRVWYPQVGSTMDVAMALATAGAPHGTLVETAEQTAGRGRRGRRWEASAGSAFLGSWLLRVPDGLDLGGLSPAVAAAALRAIDSLAPDAPVQFKWPNDVLIDGRKVAGILLTSRAAPEGTIVIAGTGVNVAAGSVPAGLDATSLSEWAAISVDQVRRRLAAELEISLSAYLAAKGLPDTDRHLLESRMASRGEPVMVLLPDGPISGIAAGLAVDGGLRLRPLDGGFERVLHVGEIVRGPRDDTGSRGETTVYLPERNRC